MAKSNVVDLDALIAEEVEKAGPIQIKEMKFQDRTWHLQCDVNSFTLSQMAAGDSGAITQFITNAVVESERAEFTRILGSVAHLGPELLLRILTTIVEAVSENPTKEPSRSRVTPTKRTSGRKSTAASSSAARPSA